VTLWIGSSLLTPDEVRTARDANVLRVDSDGIGAVPGDWIHSQRRRSEPMLRWFAHKHLPTRLQGISKPFGELAGKLTECMPRSDERTVALRKLLESKDAAVRASLDTGPAE
jgi:hypothetical protein